MISTHLKFEISQTKNIKEITLAVALQDVCHRVYVKPREENFALQIMEFFDVQVGVVFI